MSQQLKMDLMAFRHVQGRKDTTKTYTIVEGIVDLPSGSRAFCEVFLNGQFSYTPGPHVMELEITVNRDRRIEARALTVKPAAQRQAA